MSGELGLRAMQARDWRRRWHNRAATSLLSIMAVMAIAPLFFIFVYLFIRGAAGLSWAFFTELPRPVGESGGGVANAITGSAVLLALASAGGIPLGLAAGMKLSERERGPTSQMLRAVIDLMTSVPSIIVGLFAYAFLVVPLGGYSAWAGGAALMIIMLPIVARATEEILNLVPDHVREAGLALGLPRWKVTLMIILPGVKAGLATGVLLAGARVAGETAPLLFTAFSNQFGFRGLDQPIASLPVQIFTLASNPDEISRQMAWTAALSLVFLVFIVNVITRLLLRRK